MTVKRPEGYDRGATDAQRPSARPTPAPAATPRAKAPAASRSRSTAPTRPAPSRRVVEVPAKRTTPPVVRADREARAELRHAARERRRYERAEVKRFTRRSRRRRTMLFVAGGLVVVLGAMLAIAVYSPILSLRTIQVEGTSRVDAAQVRSAISDQLGTPLALLDQSRITAELGEFPLIRSFTTEIVPPSTLVVSVTEREPVAVMQSSTGWNLVDPAGVVVQTVQQLPADLPVLYMPDTSTTSDAFAAATGVIVGLPESLSKRVAWLKATTSDDVEFLLSGAAGQRVFWGSAENSEFKARVLTALIKAQKKADQVEYNVSSPESPFVTTITGETTDPTVDPTASGSSTPTGSSTLAPTSTPTP